MHYNRFICHILEFRIINIRFIWLFAI